VILLVVEHEYEEISFNFLLTEKPVLKNNTGLFHVSLAF